MARVMIQDYLRTQGLRLSLDEVQMAYLAAQTVMNMGKAEIDRSVLWYEQDETVLANHIEPTEDNETLLKQMFMALDSVLEQVGRVQSAVIYGVLPAPDNMVLRLVQQGQAIEPKLAMDEVAASCYLASRSAQNGWLNVVDNVAHWVNNGEMEGEHHLRSQSQMTIPISLSNGKVLGVLHLEAAKPLAFAPETQAAWVGLALALLEPLQTLLGMTEEMEAANV